MVNDGMVHGPEHAIGNIRRTWNLQKVAACMSHFFLRGLRSRIVHAGWTGKQPKAAFFGSGIFRSLLGFEGVKPRSAI
jgi:hypothetical protein